MLQCGSSEGPAVEKGIIVAVTSVVTDNHQTLRYVRTKSVFSGFLFDLLDNYLIQEHA